MTSTMKSEENLSPEEITRRRFLNRLSVGLGIFGAVVVGLPVASFLFEPLILPRKRVWRKVGMVEDFKIGSTTEVKMEDADPEPWAGKIAWTAAWLQRRGPKEFVAFSVNCQHLGCPVRWEEGAKLFMCPCHGGVYYENGKVAGGPPPRGLQTYPTRIKDGFVEVMPGPIPMVAGLLPPKES
ncbi:MAG: ubiquinol-cytochrome c reductase iron-sulfur subunit [bacterium]|nr:ubiquinol-cytochrome c reductase iron-sulfur subunit [bacterium]